MKPKLIFQLLAAVSSAAILTGCYTTQPPPRAQGSAAVVARSMDVRNNCYSLLYDLLKDEKDVSKLLVIKRDTSELNHLIKEISHTSGAALQRLEAYKKGDSSLTLDAINLPAGESETRKAIASTKTKELLRSSGDPFERTLLLSQVEAMNYGAHLAVVAANHDPDPARAEWLNDLKQSMRLYYVRCVKLLERPAAANTHLQATKR